VNSGTRLSGTLSARGGHPADSTALDRLFFPRSIAVVGATERPGYGARLLTTLMRTGYDGSIYSVNPSRSRVFGLPCYTSVLDLPDVPDLVAVLVPADRALDCLRQSAEFGVRAAVVISAGFAELQTDEGLVRHRALRKLVADTGLRVLGPNCLGLCNQAANVWVTATAQVQPVPVGDGPGMALISQSGATAFRTLLPLARDRGLTYRYAVTTGNEADLTAADLVEYFLRRPDVGAISLLSEGVKDFARLAHLARQALGLGKAVVIQKVGQSEAGQRAALSHSAALTGSDRVQDALFRQFGITRVHDYDELIEQTSLFLKAPAPRGVRIGVVSHSGGIGAHVADQLGVAGLVVPPLGAQTREQLVQVLGERGSAGNPVDSTSHTFGPALEPMLSALVQDPGIDALVVATAGDEEMAQRIIRAAEQAASLEVPKPLMMVWTESQQGAPGLASLQASAVPVFTRPVAAARALAALARLAEARRRPGLDSAVALGGALGGQERDSVEAEGHRILSEHRSKQLLARAGIVSPPEALCRDADEAATAARDVGYPVVLKANAPDLPHKTDHGLVQLGLSDEHQVRAAFAELLARAEKVVPGPCEGILVQPLVRGGVETIIGLTDDPALGRLVVLGLGGVFVEALGAITWRSCPIDAATADAMIADLPVLERLLAGVRGAPPADRAALADALVRLSDFAGRSGDSIESVDVNPLLVRADGQGATALDAMIVVRKPR
jgi:acetate---CoA ligase (ADP-forming)